MRLASLALFFALFTWVAAPAQAQTITCDVSDPSTDLIVARTGGGGGPAQNTYRVMFCGSSYNAGTNETTFKYKVSELSIKNDLSHWSLKLCPAAFSSYVAGSASPSAQIGDDGATGLTDVIKWNTGGGFSMGEFSFRLRGNFSTTSVVVNAKAGSHDSGSAFTVEGPSCSFNACAVLEAPTYAGGYVLNAAQTRAFIKVDVPEGATSFEFYNKSNLIVGDPEADTESGAVLTGFSRTGTLFTFSAGNEPNAAFFPITRDNPNTPGIMFFLRVTDACGQVVDVDPAFTLTGVEEDQAHGLALSAQPNPTTGNTSIRFSLSETGSVHLAVYDVLGREVAVLVNETMSAGTQTAHFDGAGLPAGVYVYRLTAGGTSITRSLTLTR